MIDGYVLTAKPDPAIVTTRVDGEYGQDVTPSTPALTQAERIQPASAMIAIRE